MNEGGRRRVLKAKIAVVYHKGKHSTRRTNLVHTGDIARSGLYHNPGERTVEGQIGGVAVKQKKNRLRAYHIYLKKSRGMK